MRILTFSCVLLLTFAVTFCGKISVACAMDTATELQFEVAVLNSWLGTGSKAEGWRKHLELNVLDTQAAKGNQADVSTLEALLDRFNGDADGLDHPAFMNVSVAIEKHLQQLRRSGGVTFSAASNGGLNFQSISADEFDSRKNAAIYDLQMMKIFMKKNLPSRPRALAYYELKPDELIDFIGDLELLSSDGQNIQNLEDEIARLADRREMVSERVRTLNEQIEKIADWMDSIKTPEGVTPPGPDDDSTRDPESENTPQLTPPKSVEQDLAPQRTPDEIEKLRKKQTIELEQRALNLELEQIEKQIQAAQESIEKIDKQNDERRKQVVADVRKLQARLAGFEKLQPKYRDIYFTAAHDSLTRLTRLYFYANSPDEARKRFENDVKTLAEAVPKLGNPRERRAAAKVGNTLGLLELGGQASEMVTAVRRKHSLPNLEIDVAGGLLQQSIGRNVAQNERVNDLILGRLIRGFASVNGDVSLELIDDPNQVHASVRLSGGVNSDTYSRSGPFTAYAGATGQYEARRSFFANVGGFFAGDVYGAASLSSYFKNIDSNLRLVQKLALKTYGETKLHSEAISSKRLEDRIVEQFSDETDEAVKNGKKQFKKLAKRQAKEAAVLPNLYVYSSRNKIHIVGKKSTMFDLAAPIPPIRSSFFHSDISVRLHETMLSNFISPLFAGKTFTSEELAERLSEFAGDIKRPEAEADAEDESFSISFDPARPIQIEFDGDEIAVAIVGRRFRQAKRAISGSLIITMRFKLVRGVDNVTRFKQDGEVSVDFADPDKKNAKLVAFRSFLEDRLNVVLGENEAISFELPDNLIPVDQIGVLEDVELVKSLSLNQLRMKDGWLYIGWNSGTNHSMVDLSGIWSENYVQWNTFPQGVAPIEESVLQPE